MAHEGKIIFGAVALIGVLSVAMVSHRAFAARPAAAVPLLDWQDAALVAEGHTLYDGHCAVCHGGLGGPALRGRGSATAPPHDASGHSWEHPDYALFQLTKSGDVAELCRSLEGSAMPQFEAALSDPQIRAVLSYIKSTWPEETRAYQDGVNAIYATQNAAVRDLVLSER